MPLDKKEFFDIRDEISISLYKNCDGKVNPFLITVIMVDIFDILEKYYVGGLDNANEKQSTE